MNTEVTNKKNGTCEQKGHEKKKQLNQLKDEEYQKLGHYDFSMFLKEDREMYRSILESEPYDWELMKFFHEQKRTVTRMKKQDARHRSRTRVEDIMDVYPDNSINDDEMIDRDFMDTLRDELKGRVSPAAFNWTIKNCIYGYSKREIARSEGVYHNWIVCSIEQTKHEMKEVLINRVFEEKKTAQGGEEDDTVPED